MKLNKNDIIPTTLFTNGSSNSFPSSVVPTPDSNQVPMQISPDSATADDDDVSEEQYWTRKSLLLCYY